MSAHICLNCEQIERGDKDCCDKPDLFCINDMPGEILKLRAASDPDRLEWLEKGNAEWRELWKSAAKQNTISQAQARIAIGHLHAVLNKARTFDEQQRADTAARDWLTSIGSEPT